MHTGDENDYCLSYISETLYIPLMFEKIKIELKEINLLNPIFC